jgi:hypothetical protein
MRTLFSTFLVGISLVAAPALAEQNNPWVASCVYTKSCVDTGSGAYGQAAQRHYNVLRGAQGNASSIRVPTPSTQSEATVHAISAMP